MSHYIYLNKYDPSFKKELPIPQTNWIDCVSSIDQLGITDESEPTLQIIDKNTGGPIPVFWIHKNGYAYIKSTPLYEYEEAMKKAYEIAQYLNATMIGEEGEIYFLQDYGLIHTEEGEYLLIDDVMHIATKENNFHYNIKQFLQSGRSKERFQQKKTNKQWWRFW